MAAEVLQTFQENDALNDQAFFRSLFRLMSVPLEHCIPAIVKDVSLDKDTVTVLPIVKNVQMTSEGSVSKDRNFVKVRRLRIAHGGYLISTPIFVGDTGWIIAGDRTCEDAKSKNSTIIIEDQDEEKDYEPNSGPTEPDDYSLGAFKNGFFIPDSWGKIEDYLEDGDMDRIVISNIDKEENDKFAKITLDREGHILIKAGTKVEIQEGDDVASLKNSIVFEKKEDGTARAIEAKIMRTEGVEIDIPVGGGGKFILESDETSNVMFDIGEGLKNRVEVDMTKGTPTVKVAVLWK